MEERKRGREKERERKRDSKKKIATAVFVINSLICGQVLVYVDLRILEKSLEVIPRQLFQKWARSNLRFCSKLALMLLSLMRKATYQANFLSSLSPPPSSPEYHSSQLFWFGNSLKIKTQAVHHLLPIQVTTHK